MSDIIETTKQFFDTTIRSRFVQINFALPSPAKHSSLCTFRIQIYRYSVVLLLHRNRTVFLSYVNKINDLCVFHERYTALVAIYKKKSTKLVIDMCICRIHKYIHKKNSLKCQTYGVNGAGIAAFDTTDAICAVTIASTTTEMTQHNVNLFHAIVSKQKVFNSWTTQHRQTTRFPKWIHTVQWEFRQWCNKHHHSISKR